MNSTKVLVTQFKQCIDLLKEILQNYSENDFLVEGKLLNEKLKNKDNYKIEAYKAKELSQTIIRIKEEKSTLEKLINDIKYKISILNADIEKRQETLSYIKNAIESLDLTKEENVRIATEKTNTIKNIKIMINSSIKQLDLYNKDIDSYNEQIEELKEKENKYSKILETNVQGINNYERNKDQSKLYKIEDIIKIYKLFNLLKDCYYDLKDNSDDMRLINNLTSLKKIAKDLNIDLNFLNNEKDRIIKQLDDANSFCFDNEESTNLKSSIALYETYSRNDEQILLSYDHNIEVIDLELDNLKEQNINLQNQINSLDLQKISTSSNKYYTILSKSIKNMERKIANNNKNIEKLLKTRMYAEFAISAVKKKKRSLDSLIENKRTLLKENVKTKVDTLTIYDATKMLEYIDIIIKSSKIISYFKDLNINMIENNILDNNKPVYTDAHKDEYALNLMNQGLNVIKFGVSPIKNVDHAEKVKKAA